MFIVEVVESFEIVIRDGFGDVDEIESHESRNVIGIFRDRDRAEQCRCLQEKIVEGEERWNVQVIVREIYSDL